MHKLPVLIQGPTGTGKELVAQTLATSGYVPFDATEGELSFARYDQVETVVRTKLRRHPWTGNMRELAQCVAEVQTTGTYVPERPDPAVALAIALRNVRVPLDDVRRRYAEIAVEKAGNPTAAARLLGVDTRTLKALLKDEPEPTLLRAPPSKRMPASMRSLPSSRPAPESKRAPSSKRRG